MNNYILSHEERTKTHVSKHELPMAEKVSMEFDQKGGNETETLNAQKLTIIREHQPS